ncbi:MULTISPECIES: hypothetical protein [Amycolatopsis]|uniref:Transmembrane protein n=1 Tax=Amycolatopsis thermalba TaxID=944492 RepID=A0ABY4NTI0_9PSEU|nr:MULTISPECIES: hypothetical protein [Amycolatopsis]OXM66166.1 hypothetical protein CF166_27470 [Amycolatopsis sp. KNN50.9b]UQS23374.1 hypothetical protein L1857_11355 [Amycolatopsis thermalba]
MSVEGAGPRSGAGEGTAPAEAGDTVVPEGRDDVRGISDLTFRIVAPYLSSAALYKVTLVLLGLMTAACVIAAPVRLSALPLIPLPVLGLGFYALRRVRAAGTEYRPLLRWSCVLFAATLFGLWLLSVVGRWVS